MSKDPMRDLSQVSGAGFTLVAYVLVFTGLGYLLDRVLGTGPWFMVGGVFVGAGIGFWMFIRTLVASDRAARTNKSDPPDQGGE